VRSPFTVSIYSPVREFLACALSYYQATRNIRVTRSTLDSVGLPLLFVAVQRCSCSRTIARTAIVLHCGLLDRISRQWGVNGTGSAATVRKSSVSCRRKRALRFSAESNRTPHQKKIENAPFRPRHSYIFANRIATFDGIAASFFLFFINAGWCFDRRVVSRDDMYRNRLFSLLTPFDVRV